MVSDAAHIELVFRFGDRGSCKAVHFTQILLELAMFPRGNGTNMQNVFQAFELAAVKFVHALLRLLCASAPLRENKIVVDWHHAKAQRD